MHSVLRMEKNFSAKAFAHCVYAVLMVVNFRLDFYTVCLSLNRLTCICFSLITVISVFKVSYLLVAESVCFGYPF